MAARAESEIAVRRYRQDDEAFVKEIFSDGMWETLTMNMRRKRALHWLGWSVGITAFVAWVSHMSYVACVCLLLTTWGCLLWLLPAFVARQYIQSCLQSDLKDILARYESTLERKGSAFWVAFNKDTNEIVGSVAVESPDLSTNVPADVFEAGDAELRRMSVKSTHRGRGVARKLFQALQRHCIANKFKRVVLSTSEFQTSAMEMYPKLGLVAFHQHTTRYCLVPFTIVFFAKKLTGLAVPITSKVRTRSTSAVDHSLW
eukprot:gb/GEZN01012163.1/.p1 GENE.gb/GEZN01012163.1/~~gb/GEZN01012163.1/.p1  ORF type:complete len:259 (-),score=32.04 gb/GEZN01012163.1/:216-992(-)